MKRILAIAALLALPVLADVQGGNRVQGYPNGLPLPTQEAGETGYFAGQTTLTPYAAAVQLNANPAKAICVRNLAQSADFIWVGSAATVTSQTGYPIAPGEEWCRTLANTNVVFVVTMAGAIVAFDGTN